MYIQYALYIDCCQAIWRLFSTSYSAEHTSYADPSLPIRFIVENNHKLVGVQGLEP